MKNNLFPIFSIAITSTAIMGYQTIAQAVQFDFSYAPGTSLEQRLGFEMAGKIWSSYLTDNMTVEIHVEMTDLLPENVIGGALPGIDAGQHIEDVYDSLELDITSADDDIAVDNMNLYHSDRRYRIVADNYEVRYNQYINLTRANSKALGLVNSHNNALDGYILMSNLTTESVEWNYDFLGNSVPHDTLDYLSVALHEIGHVLGFVSGVDDPSWLYELSEAQQNQPNKGQTNINDPEHDNQYAQLAADDTYATTLDLFRYSPESTSFGDNHNDLSVGGDKYFSIDGGATALANFSTGKDTSLGGDGYQASHWQQQSNPLGIMDPTLGLGEKGSISELDLQAFDVIGYDRQPGAVNIDLLSLFTQTKQELANEIGVWIGDIDLVLNGASYHWVDQALANSNQDRTQDVIDMIETSQVYEQWGYGSGNGNGNGGSYPVELAQLLAQEGFAQTYFSKLDLPAQATSVPEPGIKTGLLSLGLLSISSLYKRSNKHG